MRLVWLCTDIIDELVKKYGRGWREIDGGEVCEVFQCPECESYLIAEAEAEEEKVIDMAKAKRQADFLRKVAARRTKLGV